MAQSTASNSAPTDYTEFTLGTLWVSGTNTGQYGRYNGFTRDGLDALFGFTVQKRAAWDSGDTFYFDLTGTNLTYQTGDELARGFRDSAYTDGTSNKLGPEADISLSFGHQGTWGITARYDAISYTGNIINSIYTVTGTTGTMNNGFLNWGGASNNPLTAGSVTSFNATTLSPAMKEFQVGTRRDILEFGGHYIFDDWIISSNVRHEHKQGSLEESYYGTYGGMAFTLPVDYDTDRFDVSAAYNDPDLQAMLQYTYFRYTDNDVGVSLPFPVSVAALSASSGPYAQSALYATPPSNSAHYFTAMVADRLAPHTRISFNGRFGLEIQDDTFPANSADPYLSSTLGNPTYSWFSNLNALNQGTSGTSLGAVATVGQANISLTSELAEDLEGSLTYSLDGRHVHVDEFQVWGGGHGPDANTGSAYYVVPQNWFKQTGKVELGYRILPESDTRITASYAFNSINRTNAQVEHSTTNTFALDLTSMIGTETMARVDYEHNNRSGTVVYGTAFGNIESGVPEENGSPSGAYYQAPMTSDSVMVRADYAPPSDLSGGVFFKFVDERYHYSPAPVTLPAGDWNLTGFGMGVTHDSNFTIGPDINYRVSEDFNLHAFYTYERIFFDNRGNGQCAESNTGSCAGSVGYFQNKYTSSTHSVGASADWQATEKLKLKSDYNGQFGVIGFGEFNGVVVATPTQEWQNVVSYPSINSTMHELKLTASYAFTPDIEGSLMYTYSMFHNNDWSDLSAPIQTTTDSSNKISILTPGYSSPNYNISAVGVALRMKL
ncbi:MAG: MtrB/PioB family outer membrane beta-barrel protein [Alphaproteobacteria bacterium]|nr:MtrB/PioB family outer membrane beta-barrel protein [Alphaproteobacteria bacterium]